MITTVLCYPTISGTDIADYDTPCWVDMENMGFKSVFGDDIEFNTYDRTLDQDEQIRDMGDELRNHLGSPVITRHPSPQGGST